MEKKTFYITTTLPYVNADPHVGFAMEIIRADVIARAKKKAGYEVFFNTGTDEHGIKILQKAQSEGKDVKVYVDEYAEKFRGLKESLGILDEVHFIRTTDTHHEKAAQEFWKRCAENGYIYKKNYQVKYCVGCELEKTDSELNEQGECPLHPGKELELIDEENYFFKFSAFQQELLALYNGRPDFVLPEGRFNEIRAFVERGLEDFSISRLKSKMPWGITVPGDDTQVMYVWFDALVNYISTLGWPDNKESFEAYWPGIQICGKDNLRQQSAMWQAMLLSVNLPPSERILVNGFITVGGQKMSKSIGNVINPYDLVKEYGTEATRLFLLKELSQWEDSDMTLERFKSAYNSNLANGLGNLVSRLNKMSLSYFGGNLREGDFVSFPLKMSFDYGVNTTTSDGQSMNAYIHTLKEKYTDALSRYDITLASCYVWELIGTIDKYIQDYEPFKMVKTDEKGTESFLWNACYGLMHVADLLEPLMPETSKRIFDTLGIEYVQEKPIFAHKELSAGLFMRKE